MDNNKPTDGAESLDEDATAMMLKYGQDFFSFRRLFIRLGNSTEMKDAVEAFEEGFEGKCWRMQRKEGLK